MEICPADESDMLRTNLIAMRDSASAALLSPTVEISTSKPKPAATAPLTDVVARSARRLGLVIERLTKYVRPSATALEQPAQPAADLLAMAAASSTSDQQLREYLENLKQYTGDSDPANLMQVLSKNVPSWDIVVPPDAAVKPPASIEAMHKIISLTGDAAEM